MTPTLFAEIDLVQIIIVVIAMLGGFVQWLWNVIQQAKADAERRRQAPPSPKERALRDEAWKRQVMPNKPVRPAPTATPPPLQDPFTSVREIFDQVKRELAEAQKPPAHPVSRPQRQPMPKRAPVDRAEPLRNELHSPVKQAHFSPVPITVSSPPTISIPDTRPSTFVSTISTGSENQRQCWQSFLRNPGALKDAFILKEILGAPKALQSVSDSSS